MCGEMKSKNELVRVIKTSDDVIMLDTTGRKNGRGAYICKNRECVEKAQKAKGLEKSLKHSIPEEIFDELRKESDDYAE